MSDFVEVGDVVSAPAHPEWGRGQVQSVIGGKVTVTFEHVGKLVLNADATPLEIERPDWL